MGTQSKGNAVRITLVINPVASSVTRRARVVIQKALAADHTLTVIETARKGHASRLARGSAKNGAQVVVALGGDGTINEVANGLLDQDCAMVPLPGGSTNVFARAVGYPNDAIEATGVLLEALAAENIKPIGVGLANDRAFLFHVGAGFDAAVVQKVEERGPLKRYIGHPLFIASTIATWLRGVDRKNPWFSIEADDGQRVEHSQLAVALNCNPYTYLGNRPLDLAPESTVHNPLSIIGLSSLALHRLMPAAIKAIRTDEGIGNGRSTTHWSNILGATITGHRPFPYQLDGEFLDPVDMLRLDHRPNAVNLVFPVGRPTDEQQPQANQKDLHPRPVNLSSNLLPDQVSR